MWCDDFDDDNDFVRTNYDRLDINYYSFELIRLNYNYDNDDFNKFHLSHVPHNPRE